MTDLDPKLIEAMLRTVAGDVANQTDEVLRAVSVTVSCLMPDVVTDELKALATLVRAELESRDHKRRNTEMDRRIEEMHQGQRDMLKDQEYWLRIARKTKNYWR